MRGEKKERILRVLLGKPDGSLSYYRIAKEAHCTHVWALKFLKTLEQKNLVTHTKVHDMLGLYYYWKSINNYPPYKEFNIQQPLNLLKKTSLTYALTTYYAETLTQKYLFPTRVDIYIKQKDINKWQDLLSKKGLAGKGNMRLLLEDDHVFYANRKKNGVRLVSTPQLILDLLREEGVAVEAAHMLLEKTYHDTL